MKLKEQLLNKKFFIILFVILILSGTSVIIGIVINSQNSSDNIDTFPDFITKNDEYFTLREENIPEIKADSYNLLIWGQIDNPKNFTLNELLKLNLTERTLTTECIGNPPKGPLLSTAVWKGFLIYDLLISLGLKESATGVMYFAADGYYVFQTLDQIRDNGTIGALFMNGEVLPPVQGFPLRIVTPGAYGAKQPAWVIEIKVIDRQLKDYWDDKGWDTSPPMAVDSTIFFPKAGVVVKVAETLEIGGAAFGGTRISKVEYIIDGITNWTQAPIIKSLDLDHVWVFWKISVVFDNPGIFKIFTKATDIFNNTQPEKDLDIYDGNNGWPLLLVNVIE